VESLKELREAYSKLFPFGNTFDEEKKKELRYVDCESRSARV
jgi:hypothetical protein